MSNGCVIQGWSVVASASMNSQVAGVLAGFVFTSIVLLLGRRSPRDRQSLGLFCAVFVALGFDSHLWGVVSGDATDPLCIRVWSEAMPAAGMLAVGAMAIITGISWLMVSHANASAEFVDFSTPRQSSQPINLGVLVRFMAYGVGVTVTVLLATTTYDYLTVAFPSHLPTSLIRVAVLSPVVVATVSAATTLIATRLGRRGTATRARLSNTALKVAAYGVLFYAVAGPVFAGMICDFGANFWQPASRAAVDAAIIAGLVFPSLILIALVLAVPPISAREAVKNPHVEKAGPRHARTANHSTICVKDVKIVDWWLEFDRNTPPNNLVFKKPNPPAQ